MCPGSCGVLALLLPVALAINCSSNGGDGSGGQGGATGGAGQVATGGAPGSAGAMGIGGSVGSGGSTGVGGTSGTGGAIGSGGRTGSGGADAGVDSGPAGVGGAGTGGMGTGGAGTGGMGTGGAGTGGMGTGGAGIGGAAGACASLKINEVQVASIASANDEFIEIYNPCTTPVDLNGYRLVYRAQTSLIDTTVALFTTGTIAAQGFWLVASYFPAGLDQSFGINVHLADTAGGVGLRNPSATLIDSVAYGTGVTNQLIEGGLAAQVPPAGRSLIRRPDGSDTNSNAVDFSQLSGVPSPRASNQ